MCIFCVQLHNNKYMYNFKAMCFIHCRFLKDLALPWILEFQSRMSANAPTQKYACEGEYMTAQHASSKFTLLNI